jgi:hypothetical protein
MERFSDSLLRLTSGAFLLPAITVNERLRLIGTTESRHCFAGASMMVILAPPSPAGFFLFGWLRAGELQLDCLSGAIKRFGKLREVKVRSR